MHFSAEASNEKKRERMADLRGKETVAMVLTLLRSSLLIPPDRK